jgi:hypothetical protein
MSIFCSNYVTDMAVGMVAILYYFHLKNGLVHAMQSNGPLQQVTHYRARCYREMFTIVTFALECPACYLFVVHASTLLRK